MNWCNWKARLKHCALLVQHRTAKVRRASERDWILDTVFTVAQELGVECYYKQLLDESKRPTVRDKLQAVREWLERAGKDKSTRIALLRMGLPLLYADLGWMDVAVNGATIVRYLHRLPAVFDRHFPGYARIGLLSIIVEGKGHAA
jgi:hypothetical protein